MPNNRLRSIFLPLTLATLLSCSSTSDEPPYTGRYVAHVELESSRLLATELLSGLETPWDITWGDDGWVWINEHKGTVSRLNPETGEHQTLLQVPDVHFQRAMGLLSMALHPEFSKHPYIWLHYVYSTGEDEFSTRIVRYRFEDSSLTDRTIIADPLPGDHIHNGSRMVIDEDGYLWFGGGELNQPERSQDLSSYHGKVLRMHQDGTIPEDNPIPGSPVWSSGHRNIQGLAFGNGFLYAAEHGANTDDEINLIQKGGNYGWPDVQGYCDSETEKAFCADSLVIEPLHAFTPVVAAAGLAYYDHPAIPEWQNSLLLANLRIQALRVLPLSEDGEEVTDVKIFFQQVFGRLRDVTIDQDGRVYLATSNMDWYKTVRPDIHDVTLEERGDRIILLQPLTEELEKQFADVDEPVTLREDTTPLYLGDN